MLVLFGLLIFICGRLLGVWIIDGVFGFVLMICVCVYIGIVFVVISVLNVVRCNVNCVIICILL